MKHYLLAVICFFYYASFAQKTVDIGAGISSGIEAGSSFAAGSMPYNNVKYVNLIEGTPYLTTDWLKGAIKVKSGQRFSGSLLKYDFVNNQLHFLSKEGVDMLVSSRPIEMWFEDTLSNTGYHFINASEIGAKNTDKYEWYEVVESGKVMLYNVYHKSFSESLPYNSSVYEQKINTREKYYVIVNNALVHVKNIKDMPNYLSDKKAELEDYLNKQDNKNNSVATRWKNLIQFYNSL